MRGASCPGMSDVERPKSIPVGAEWDSEHAIWEAGFRNARTEKHGPWRVWNEEGRLIGEQHFENDSLIEERSFHEDGTLFEHNRHSAVGMPILRMTQRAPSGPPIGRGIPEHVYRVEYVFDAHGYMSAYRFFDEQGGLLDDTPLFNDASNQVQQIRYPDLESASRDWRERGGKFTSALNRWLDVIYKQNRDNEEPEPVDDRRHMERAIVSALEHYNARGEFEVLREQFPPAYEPFSSTFWRHYGRNITQVFALDNDAMVVRVGPETYLISGNDILPQPAVLAVGGTRDKRLIALAFTTHVEVRESWAGAPIATFAYPPGYDAAFHAAHPELRPDTLRSPERMGIRSILVHPDGRRVVLVTKEGIFLLTATGSRLLFPERAELDQYFEQFQKKTEGQTGSVPFELDIDFPSADLSPDGRILTCCGMFARGIFANLTVYEERGEGAAFEKKAWSGDQAFFPRIAAFHDRHPSVAFAATLYASFSNLGDSIQNTTFRIAREQLDQGGEIDGFDGGVFQGRGRVESIAPFGDGFLLGMSNGYVWHMSATEDATQLGYVHLGGQIQAIDVSPDGSTVFIGSDTGMVIRLAVGERDPNLITDLPLKDTRRALFWKTFPPMIW